MFKELKMKKEKEEAALKANEKKRANSKLSGILEC